MQALALRGVLGRCLRAIAGGGCEPKLGRRSHSKFLLSNRGTFPRTRFLEQVGESASPPTAEGVTSQSGWVCEWRRAFCAPGVGDPWPAVHRLRVQSASPTVQLCCPSRP